MNKTYVSITITYYSHPRIAPDVHYYFDNGVDPRISRWDMSVEEANRRMWELVGMGSKNEYRSNPYNNAISERHVAFWGQL